nr:hypothetical protein [Plastoroseomonas arctica]
MLRQIRGLGQQRDRQQGVGDALFPGDQRDKRRDGDRAEAGNQWQQRRIHPASLVKRDQRRGHRQDEQAQAQPVEAQRALPRRGHAREAQRHHAGEHRQRGCDEEDRPPAEMLRQVSTAHRAEGRGGGKNRRDMALEPSAFARRQRLTDDGHRQREQPAAADPLQHAPGNQHRQRGRDGIHQAPREVHAKREVEDVAPPIGIAELSEHWRCAGAGHQVGDHHPGHPLDGVELGRDGGQRRGGHRLVHRGEEDRQRDRGEAPQEGVAARLDGIGVGGEAVHVPLTWDRGTPRPPAAPAKRPRAG